MSAELATDTESDTIFQIKLREELSIDPLLDLEKRIKVLLGKAALVTAINPSYLMTINVTMPNITTRAEMRRLLAGVVEIKDITCWG